MPRPFFKCTKDAQLEITALFDFIWPTAAAMWNLRWQVQGYLQVAPNASVGDLQSRFLHGSNVQGANLRRVCVQQSWDHQMEMFSSILLTQLFATYESWISAVLHALGFRNKTLEKELQFPTRLRGTRRFGIREAITQLTVNQSAALVTAFYPTLKRNPKYSEPALDNLLLCYRYFKEMRNCLIHRGGVADDKAETAYQEFAPIATTADLGLPEVPLHTPISKGDRVSLKLRGVVGFSDVVNRLIMTVDAELARATAAEKELVQRWKGALGKKHFLLPGDAKRRRRKLTRLLNKLDFPRLHLTDDSIETILKGAKLIA